MQVRSPSLERERLVLFDGDGVGGAHGAALHEAADRLAQAEQRVEAGEHDD